MRDEAADNDPLMNIQKFLERSSMLCVFAHCYATISHSTHSVSNVNDNFINLSDLYAVYDLA